MGCCFSKSTNDSQKARSIHGYSPKLKKRRPRSSSNTPLLNEERPSSEDELVSSIGSHVTPSRLHDLTTAQSDESDDSSPMPMIEEVIATSSIVSESPRKEIVSKVVETSLKRRKPKVKRRSKRRFPRSASMENIIDVDDLLDDDDQHLSNTDSRNFRTLPPSMSTPNTTSANRTSTRRRKVRTRTGSIYEISLDNAIFFPLDSVVSDVVQPSKDTLFYVNITNALLESFKKSAKNLVIQCEAQGPFQLLASKGLKPSEEAYGWKTRSQLSASDLHAATLIISSDDLRFFQEYKLYMAVSALDGSCSFSLQNALEDATITLQSDSSTLPSKPTQGNIHFGQVKELLIRCPAQTKSLYLNVALTVRPPTHVTPMLLMYGSIFEQTDSSKQSSSSSSSLLQKNNSSSSLLQNNNNSSSSLSQNNNSSLSQKIINALSMSATQSGTQYLSTKLDQNTNIDAYYIVLQGWFESSTHYSIHASLDHEPAPTHFQPCPSQPFFDLLTKQSVATDFKLSPDIAEKRNQTSILPFFNPQASLLTGEIETFRLETPHNLSHCCNATLAIFVESSKPLQLSLSLSSNNTVVASFEGHFRAIDTNRYVGSATISPTDMQQLCKKMEQQSDRSYQWSALVQPFSSETSNVLTPFSICAFWYPQCDIDVGGSIVQDRVLRTMTRFYRLSFQSEGILKLQFQALSSSSAALGSGHQGVVYIKQDECTPHRKFPRFASVDYDHMLQVGSTQTASVEMQVRQDTVYYVSIESAQDQYEFEYRICSELQSLSKPSTEQAIPELTSGEWLSLKKTIASKQWIYASTCDISTTDQSLLFLAIVPFLSISSNNFSNDSTTSPSSSSNTTTSPSSSTNTTTSPSSSSNVTNIASSSNSLSSTLSLFSQQGGLPSGNSAVEYENASPIVHPENQSICCLYIVISPRELRQHQESGKWYVGLRNDGEETNASISLLMNMVDTCNPLELSSPNGALNFGVVPKYRWTYYFVNVDRIEANAQLCIHFMCSQKVEIKLKKGSTPSPIDYSSADLLSFGGEGAHKEYSVTVHPQSNGWWQSSMLISNELLEHSKTGQWYIGIKGTKQAHSLFAIKAFFDSTPKDQHQQFDVIEL